MPLITYMLMIVFHAVQYLRFFGLNTENQFFYKYGKPLYETIFPAK